MSESEADAIDRMIERMAREGEEAIARAHGEHILRIAKDSANRKEAEGRALLDWLARARREAEGDQQ
jgi:hypothetical protein